MSVINIDKGWAWAVPIGGFIANFIVGGLAKSFGIIMRSTQELYDSDAAPLTLAGGLIYTFMYCLSLAGILLSEKYGCRIIINIGAFGCVISFICAYFAKTVIMWVIAIGGGVGISLGFIYSPIFVMVGRSFRKRVGVAMGLSVAGVSVGQMAFPSLITAVIDTYSARGAFLVGAGIASHFFITAALMPRYIAEDETYKKANSKIPKNGSINKNGDIEKVPLKTLNENLDENLDENLEVKFSDNENPRPREEKTFTKMHIVMLIMFVSAKVFSDIGDVGIAFALPPFGETTLEMDNKNISRAIGVAGGVDFVARVIIGYVSDQTWCRRSILLNAAWLLEAFNTFLFIWFPYFTSYFIFYGIFGMCSGTAITLMTVVLTDLVGQKNMPISFAIMMFSVGLVIAGGQYLVGYLADITKTYEVSLMFLGYNMFLAFFIMSLEYPIKKIFFHTTAGTADLYIPKNNGNTDESKQLENLDPTKDLRSRLSSISTLSHMDAKAIFA